MGKKNMAEIAAHKIRFVDGLVTNGIKKAKAKEIFDLLAKFAEYGFNKSHSAAYGYLSYQTAWLKAHYRPEDLAALMSVEAARGCGIGPGSRTVTRRPRACSSRAAARPKAPAPTTASSCMTGSLSEVRLDRCSIRKPKKSMTGPDASSGPSQASAKPEVAMA